MLTKKQLAVMDELHNGGYIWQAGNQYYIAKVIRVSDNGVPQFKSDKLGERTFRAIYASSSVIYKDNKWVAK